MKLGERISGWLSRHFASKNIVGSIQRYYVTPRQWPVRVFLHWVYDPDPDRYPHDHPWSFITIPLFGSYVEQVFNRGRLICEKLVRWPFPRWRNYTYCHKVVKVNGPCLTLAIAFKTRTGWGFWKPDGTFFPYGGKEHDGFKPESQ